VVKDVESTTKEVNHAVGNSQCAFSHFFRPRRDPTPPVIQTDSRCREASHQSISDVEEVGLLGSDQHLPLYKDSFRLRLKLPGRVNLSLLSK